MTIDELLFDDIGDKIQRVAKVIAWFFIIISVIGGACMVFVGLSDLKHQYYLILLAPVVVLSSCLSGWLSVIVLYGFGKLVSDVEEIKEKNNTASIAPVTVTETPAPQVDYEHEKAHQCECGAIYHGMFCPVCGAKSGTSKRVTVTIGGPAKKSADKMVRCVCGERYYGDVCPKCGREKQ